MKKLINKFCVALLSLSIIAQFTGWSGGDLVYAAVTDNTGTSHLEFMVGEPNTDSNDTLFSLLYDILEKLTKLDTINESVVAMKESVDKMETSSTNVQYVVNSLAGNQVAITVPAMQNVKSTLSVNIDQNASDYIFTDPANGISYSVVNYDPVTDELTLFMRQIIGEYRKPSQGGVPYGTSIEYFYYQGEYTAGYRAHSYDTDLTPIQNYSHWAAVQWAYPDPTSYFQNFIQTLSNPGILSKCTSVLNLRNQPYVNAAINASARQIPVENRSYISGKYCDTYWFGDDFNPGTHGVGSFYAKYAVCDNGAIDSACYHHWAGDYEYNYDAGLRGIVAVVKIKGNLGDVEYVKDLCTDWLKMSNTSLGSTGIEVFDTGYLLNAIGTEVGTIRTYKDTVHKYKHDLYVNTSENNLTSSVSNALLTGAAGGKFSIPYTSTMSTKTFTNEAALGTNHQKYVDVIIRDPSDNILYFGRIAKAKLGDNLITFTLPNDLQEDVPYLLQMFEESYYDHQGISTISTPVNARLVISNE